MNSCVSESSLCQGRHAKLTTETPRPGIPLIHAHAHNDYKHEKPLFDALENGFTTIEADIFLKGDELRVAHLITGTKKGRTLESLYLEPLSKILEEQQTRSIYPTSDRPLQLMVDVKSGGDAVHEELDRLLEKYAPILTTFKDGVAHEKAVTIMVSGNRPSKAFLKKQHAQPENYLTYDGRLSDIRKHKTKLPSMHLVSANWKKHFSWRGVGPMPLEEELNLRSMVKAVHENGQDLRFWSTPDKNPVAREAVWTKLLEEKVDLISTDKLPELSQFLLQHQALSEKKAAYALLPL